VLSVFIFYTFVGNKNFDWCDHMEDTFEAKGKRKKLVAELRRKGISDEEVLRAIDTVPRHLFMDPAFLIHAYVDKAFPITSGQTISQP